MPTAPTPKSVDGAWSRKNWAPFISLQINGSSANDLLALCTSFSYKREVQKAAEVKFVFRNDARNVEDDTRLFPNTVWLVRFGFFTDMSPIISVAVRQVEPVFDMKRTVSVTLHDGTSAIAQTSSRKNWGRVPASEIARQIAKRNGLKAEVETSAVPAKEFVQPGEVNDLQYLRDIAADAGDFEVFVDTDTLVFRKKPYDKAAIAELVYYDEPSDKLYVTSFKPKVKSLGPLSSNASSASAKKGDKDSSQGADATNRVQLDGNDGKATTPASQGKAGVTKALPSGVGAGAIAKAARTQMLDKANEANSNHPLTPSIQAGKNYVWNGVGKQLSGKWYCHSVNHEISGTGAKTSAEWKRNQNPSTTGKKDDKKTDKNGQDYSNKVVVDGTDGKSKYVPPSKLCPQDSSTLATRAS